MNKHRVPLSSKLLVHLYGLQSATYALAAGLSWYNGHPDLCTGDAFSTIIHAGFAACHRVPTVRAGSPQDL